MMDKCLLACDELTGFVIACCLVRPEGIATLEPKSVKKKLKDKAFAAKVDREIIRSSVELLGVDMDEPYPVRDRRPEAPCRGIGDRGQGNDADQKYWFLPSCMRLMTCGGVAFFGAAAKCKVQEADTSCRKHPPPPTSCPTLRSPPGLGTKLA